MGTTKDFFESRFGQHDAVSTQPSTTSPPAADVPSTNPLPPHLDARKKYLVHDSTDEKLGADNRPGKTLLLLWADSRGQQEIDIRELEVQMNAHGWLIDSNRFSKAAYEGSMVEDLESGGTVSQELRLDRFGTWLLVVQEHLEVGPAKTLDDASTASLTLSATLVPLAEQGRRRKFVIRSEGLGRTKTDAESTARNRAFQDFSEQLKREISK